MKERVKFIGYDTRHGGKLACYREDPRGVFTVREVGEDTFQPIVTAELVAQMIAHRACCGAEHDPANGKIHGYCIVCGVPWPCDYAGKPPSLASLPASEPAGAVTGQAQEPEARTHRFVCGERFKLNCDLSDDGHERGHTCGVKGCGRDASDPVHAVRVSVESGHDERTFSASYARPVTVYVDDLLVYPLDESRQALSDLNDKCKAETARAWIAEKRARESAQPSPSLPGVPELPEINMPHCFATLDFTSLEHCEAGAVRKLYAAAIASARSDAMREVECSIRGKAGHYAAGQFRDGILAAAEHVVSIRPVESSSGKVL